MSHLLTRTHPILTPEEGWKLINQATQDLKSFELQLKTIQALIQSYLQYDPAN